MTIKCCSPRPYSNVLGLCVHYRDAAGDSVGFVENFEGVVEGVSF